MPTGFGDCAAAGNVMVDSAGSSSPRLPLLDMELVGE